MRHPDHIGTKGKRFVEYQGMQIPDQIQTMSKYGLTMRRYIKRTFLSTHFDALLCRLSLLTIISQLLVDLIYASVVGIRTTIL